MVVAVASLTSALSVSVALRQGVPFTLSDPEQQLDFLARHYSQGVMLGLMLFVKSVLGVVAVAAVAISAAGVHPTRAALGGSFAAAGFLAHAARGLWFAAIEPAAAVRFAGGDAATRQAMLTFLQLNLLYHHFFNWLYIVFAGMGFALLGWALWPEARRLGGAFWLAGAAHAVHFPATLTHYYSVFMWKRQLPLLSLFTETAAWLFPGLAFLLAALWLQALSERNPRRRRDAGKE